MISSVFDINQIKPDTLVYLDSDGVLLDFNSIANDVLADRQLTVPILNKMAPRERDAVMVWMYEKCPDLFAMEPALEVGQNLVNALRNAGVDFKVLTHMTPHLRYDKQIADKQDGLWYAHSIPSSDIICLPTAASKSYFCQQAGDILVDDWDYNLKHWSAKGGNGYLVDDKLTIIQGNER